MRHFMYKYDMYSFLSLLLACLLLFIGLIKSLQIAIYIAMFCIIISLTCDAYVLVSIARRYEGLFQYARGIILLLILLLLLVKQ